MWKPDRSHTQQLWYGLIDVTNIQCTDGQEIRNNIKIQDATSDEIVTVRYADALSFVLLQCICHFPGCNMHSNFRGKMLGRKTGIPLNCKMHAHFRQLSSRRKVSYSLENMLIIFLGLVHDHT